jgi:predicted nucleic acid-binding protein
LIVLDASATIEFLFRADSLPILANAISSTTELACPAILDFEVMNVLRKQIQNRIVTVERAEQALDLYNDMTFVTFETPLIADRIWNLRNNFTAYDASYIALAELLEVPLYSKDRKWSVTSAHRADIRFI